MAQNRTSKIKSYFSVKREDDVKAQCNHCRLKITENKVLDAIFAVIFIGID